MVELLRFGVAHLLGAWQRTAAAASAIFVAVTSFVILTGTVTTQQLQVTRTVASNYRSTYDILIRPPGSLGPLESSADLVRPNFLSGSYGGITLNQVKQISAVPGVEVAAPVAVLGQTMRNVLIPIDVSKVLDGKDHAMVRYALTGTARNGTAHTANQHGYLYLTKSALTTRDGPSGAPADASPAQIEKRNGTTLTACLPSTNDSANAPAQSFLEQCWSSRAQGGTRPRVEILLSLPLTVEAVDPDAEAQLTGLRSAMTAGRALTGNDAATVDNSGPAPLSVAPAVMAAALPFDYQASVTVQELPQTTMDQVLATSDAATRRKLVLEATPERTIATVTRDAAATYRDDVVAAAKAGASGQPDQSLFIQSLIQPGDVTYISTDPLRPRVVPFNSKAWRAENGNGPFVPTPTSVTDTGYRQIAGQPRTDTSTFVTFKVVGTYDAERLPRPARLNEVPLETYRSSTLLGADGTSRRVLGDQPLRSDLNPAGYVQSPPAILVPLKALPLFWKSFNGLDRQAPVSSVRVRVAGITGPDPVAREKIRQVADTIKTRTGLQVDITIGASLQNRRVALPATASGTPGLDLNEQWTKKGVAIAITQALDLKSLALFIVILISSTLTVALIAAATVATRRRELATLACVGWSSTRMGLLVAGELALLGLAAGLLAASVSWPLAHIMGISITWWRVALAIPLGAVLALIPGLGATLRASRTAPLDAFRPNSNQQPAGSGLSLTGSVSLGLIMANSRRGRSMVGALALALAVAAALTLAIVVRTFNGAVVGSFLGDAVALQVRGPDIAAATILALLGLVAVATVLLLALMEDAPGFAALRATGWTERALNTTLATQAAVIGALGAVIGVALALTTTGVLIGPPTAPTLALAALTPVVAIAFATASCALPAALLGRLPTARILANE